MRTFFLSAAVAAAMFYSSSSCAADAAASCASSQLKASSSYVACRLKVDAAVAAKGGAADYSKCDATFVDKYGAAETKAGSGVCASEGDVTEVRDFLSACDDSVTTAVTTGAALPLDPIACASDLSECDTALAATGSCSGNLSTCTSSLGTCSTNLSSTNADLGTCNTNLSSTNADLGTCNSSLGSCSANLSSTNADLGTCNTNLSSTNADLGTCNSSLGSCSANLSSTNADLGTCNTNLSSTNADLAACQSQPVCGDGVVAGGETCEAGNLNSASCVSEGFAGGTLACATGCTFNTSGCYVTRFVDNGDGTITDNQTKLIWEKKSDAGDIHDKDNSYIWGSDVAPYQPNGSAYLVFLATLNGAFGGECFTGKCDWRLPTRYELAGLIDASESAPMIFSVFKAGATAGCSATSASCSWTRSGAYWSSSPWWNQVTYAWVLTNAFVVSFSDGGTAAYNKKNLEYARAVRAGS